jgi:hypothetical protein
MQKPTRYLLFLFLFIIAILKSEARDYFQQHVVYEIHAALDDKKHLLKCQERVTYTNNSLDSLHDIYFHIWPNAYRNDETNLANQLSKMGSNRFAIAKDKDFGYIDGLSFRSDGKAIDWELLEDTIDICVLHLKNPLAPAATITFDINFRVQIPAAFLSRLGHDREAYYISQWYPKPAVYDQHGWNYFSYLDKGEYYSDFGTFDVYITLPKNYVVAATGTLKEDDPEIQWLDSIADATKKLTAFTTDMSFPLSDTATKTLHYHAEQVHDFAWFADKRYHVLKDEMQLPGSENKITLWSMFTNAEASLWLKANEYSKDAITYFSKWIGNYPYAQFTCADVTDASGNGMEYPMLTAIGTYGSAFDLEATIQHEIGHSWFYGVLASNERMFPWMDEGMTQFLETRYTYTKYANDSAKMMERTYIFGARSNTSYNHRKLEYLKYWHGARANTDQAPSIPAGEILKHNNDTLMYSVPFTGGAENYSSINYSADVYRKTALSFDYLKCYLGDSLFDLCMHAYYDQWKFRHPYPEDVRKIFEETSQKKLDWFFDDLLQTTKKIDYKICSAKGSGGSYSVKVRNAGDISSPVSLSAMKDGKVLSTEWFDGFQGKQAFTFQCQDCDIIKVDGGERIPESRRRNNAIKTSGILKKMEKLQLRVPVAEEDPNRTQLYFAPIIGWNNYNKWMFGGSVHNLTLIEKRFEYLAAPMYSPATKSLAGGGRVNYHYYLNSSFINKITFGVGASTYTYRHYSEYIDTTKQDFSADLAYRKISSNITFSFLNRKTNPDDYNTLTLRHVYVEYDLEDSTALSQPGDSINVYHLSVSTWPSNSYFLIYNIGNQVKYNPYDFKLIVGQTLNLGLASLEFNQTISFNKKGRGLEYRIFTGFNGEMEDKKFRNSGHVDARFHMNGQKGNSNGIYQDYLFDEVFLGRSETEGILSQQFTATQGGLKVATDYEGQAKTWLMTVNVKIPFPGKLPLYFFADAGAFDKAKVNSLKSETDFMYDAGVEIRLLPKVLSVYLPFFYSTNIRDVYDEFPDRYDTYLKKIRFELNISNLNPFTLRDQVRF